MQAEIKSLELKKILKNYYIKITIERQGKEYVLSKPLLSNPINFRKQVFGILTACNCYDFLRLARKEPMLRKTKGYYVQNKGQVYYGFGYPINIGNNGNESDKMKSAKLFTSFVTSIMRFYGENDLLKLGGQIEDYPKVEITLDKRHRIKSITNADTKLGLIVGENYEIGMIEPPLQAPAMDKKKERIKREDSLSCK